MRSTIFAVVITLLLLGTPSFALDSDLDGVEDEFDNCSDVVNYGQDDTDGDDCGNSCDADYNDDGVVGHPGIVGVKDEHAGSLRPAQAFGKGRRIGGETGAEPGYGSREQ